MKLNDIVTEADKAPAEGKPLELKDLVKYFPNNYKRAVNTMAKAGRLTFGGDQVFDKDGNYGPALDRAQAEAEAYLKDKNNTIDVNVEMDGSVADIDEHAVLTMDMPMDQFQEEYVGYAVRGDRIVFGFDVWLDEDIFNQDWDKKFEETFGEEFDNDNKAHEKIFNAAYKEWKNVAFLGVLIEVDEKYNATMDSMALDGGVHASLKRVSGRMGLVDFNLEK